LLDTLLVTIKINFSRYIDRFERENMNVVEFGEYLDYRKKIDKINKQIENYARKDRQREAVKEGFPKETTDEEGSGDSGKDGAIE